MPPPTGPIFVRPFGRRAFVRAAASLSAGGAALYLTGCGSAGDDAGKTPLAATTTAAPDVVSVEPALLASELIAGQDNRFLIGLLDQEKRLVKDASVHLRFFKIGGDGKTGEFRGEGEMTYRELNIEGAHAHDGGGGVLSEDTVSFYAANVPFDDAGRWGVEIEVTPQNGASPSKVQVPFDVLETPKTPADGSMPPASMNDTAATNPDTASLCSRDPICSLHDVVIGDVLGKGRPLVVQFSTPAYCQTRFCGPVLEVLLSKAPEYRDSIDFVHIEVYKDFQSQEYRRAVVEWGLPGEPYTFFVGSDGLVKSRLEAIFTSDELVERLDALLA